MARMQNRVALITGAGAGIGAAAAMLFSREGAAVALVDCDEQALQRSVADIKQLDPYARIISFVADVAKEEDAIKAVAMCVKSFGSLDTLISNAAMRNYSSIANATSAEWQAVLSVNLMGAANYARAALPSLRKSGKGSIVNVSSCYAVAARKHMGLYDATKAALLALTDRKSVV